MKGGGAGGGVTRIVAIGGGTGLSVLLRGLRSEKSSLAAVVTVADDGGNSGALREDLGMLPPGDVRSCLLALADEEDVMQEVLKYRFKSGRLAGQNIGNLMIAALNDIYGNFEDAVSKLSDILKIQGRVIPVTGDEVRLCAELRNGSLVLGESQIARVALREGSPISKVYLTPPGSEASASAVAAVEEADIALIGPGSLFTSIIPNFLSRGMTEALLRAKCRKVYVCNVMTQPGETDGFGVAGHVDALRQYMGGAWPDCVISNNRELSGASLSRYASDGARQVLPCDEDRAILAGNGVRLIEGDFIETKKGYIRHDSKKIAGALGLSPAGQ